MMDCVFFAAELHHKRSAEVKNVGSFPVMYIYCTLAAGFYCACKFFLYDLKMQKFAAKKPITRCNKLTAMPEVTTMKKEVKLYNVLFPFWMLLLFPQFWLIVLPGNFIIDSLVLLAGIYLLKIANKKNFYKSNILKIFGFGILSDVIGSAYMFIMISCFDIGRMGDEWYLTLPALAISAVCIFLFNYYVTLRKYDRRIRFKLALTFAVATAPYTFLVPSSWLYG